MNFKSNLSSLQQAFRLCWQSSPSLTIVSCVLLLGQSLLPIASLYLTKLIVDALSQGLHWNDILVLIILAAGMAIATDWLNALAVVVGEAHARNAADFIQNLLHAKSIEMDLEYYENAQYYDKLHRVQSEASYRPPLILSRTIQLVRGTVSLAAIAVLLISVNWVITALLLLTLLPLLAVRFQSARQLYLNWQQWTVLERRAGYFSNVLTRESYAKEIRLFDLGNFFSRQFRRLRQEVRRGKLKLALRRFFAEAVAQTLAAIAVFGALAFIAQQTLRGALTVGSLVMYFQAFQRGQGLMRDTVRSMGNIYENSLFLTSFSDFLSLEPRIVTPEYPRIIPDSPQQGLRVQQLSFYYPHGTRPVLRDLNFSIYPGETISLVGENGSGKTTLIKLLCRLYDPCEGRITWDGTDLREFSPSSWREQISAVFQDYGHYDLLARENIGLGNVRKMEEVEDIKEAARRAGVEGAIARLRRGFETMLGHQFAEGEELSMGEWQKIAIARCFLRPTPLTILDEPTSALDPQAEAEILQQFRQLSENRIAIFISHRLSSVRLSDRILVLDGGAIAESGTHDQLMGKSGIYARLFETQAEFYR
ncbi:MAG: ABC transporter ATP-binding protein [Cyanobacteriota bacterium]|nr:ABC transporter ATP-binding protein [Cyanobacteriota bacterium]